MRREEFGRRPLAKSRNPYTCGITGRPFSFPEVFQRSEFLARAFAKRLGWSPNEGTAWDKVLSIYSFNTVSPHPAEPRAVRERRDSRGTDRLHHDHLRRPPP